MAEAPITPAEIHHAATPEAAKIGAANKAVEAKSARIRARMTATRNANPGEAFKSALQAEKQMRPGGGENAIKSNIGTQRREDGSKVIPPGSEIEKRLTRAKAAEATARGIAEGRIKLKGALSKDQQDALISVIKSSPWAELDPALQTALIEGAMADPDFVIALKNVYGETIAMRVEDNVTAVRQRVDAADSALAVKKSARDIAAARLAGAMAAERSFVAGKDGTRLTALGKAKPDVELRKLNEARSRDEALLRDTRIQLRARPGDPHLLGEIARLEGSLTASLTTVIQHEQDLAELNALKAGKEKAPDRTQELEDRLASAEEAFQIASGQKGLAEVELTDALDARAEQENTFVSEMEAIPAEALTRYLALRLDRATAAADEEVGKMIDEAKTANGKKMGELMRRRYFKRKTSRVRRYDESMTEDSKDNLRKDMKTLTRPSAGPEAVIREELEYALAHGQITADQKTEILNDSALMEEWAGKFTEKIITGYVRNGGKLTPSTLAYIESQEWGKEWVDKGIEQNKNVQQLETQLKEKGILGAEGLRGFLKTKKGKSLLAILAGIAAGIITGPAALPAALSAIAVGGGAGGGLAAGEAYSKGKI